MWRRMKRERLTNGMPITPVCCDKCMKIWRFFTELPLACPSCGAIHDLVLNEDGSIETTQPTEEELAEIDRLKKENEELKTRLGELSFRLIVMELKDQGYDISKFTDENEE